MFNTISTLRCIFSMPNSDLKISKAFYEIMITPSRVYYGEGIFEPVGKSYNTKYKPFSHVYISPSVHATLSIRRILHYGTHLLT